MRCPAPWVLPAWTAILCLTTMSANLSAAADAALDAHRDFNFANHIVPLLSRYSCNSSGCHGKAEGQNGFKLSVFGFDPVADYRAILMEGRGRRVFPAAPERSLLLMKACGDVPHGGGVRIDKGGREYALLRDWISAGMPLGSDDDPQVVSIEVVPHEKTLAMRESVDLRVMAAWSDGAVEDVTWLAQFQSNKEGLATVDETGHVTAGLAPGHVAVMASYLGHVDVFEATVPRPARQGDTVQSESAVRNFIDRRIQRRLDQLNITAAGDSTESEFLRRAYLTIIGTLPTAEQARAYLAETRPDRRRRLVDALLDRPEYADYWALYWSDLLRVDRQTLGHKDAYQYYRWIRESLAENKPLDQFAREILTAEGPLSEVPQGNLFQVVRGSGETASMVSQVFLGVRIECAQCHHHPFDRWGQDDYYGMAGMFAQVRTKTAPWGAVLTAEGNPSTKQPRSGRFVFAHPLGAPEPEENPTGDRREAFAAWLTAPDNAFFARNMVNRVWARMMGRGLVEPVDDFRATNPASHPELLDDLAEHFIAEGYDLKSLIRTIAASHTFQQSPETNATNREDEQSFSRSYWRRLDAEVLLDAVCQATGVPEEFEGVPVDRALHLWDSQTRHDFLKMFGRPVRKSACECERNVEPSVAQVLHLLNSERIQEKLSSPRGTVARLTKGIKDDRRLVEDLYLATLSRYPDADESARAVAYIEKSTRASRQAAEDVLWTLLNSLEFSFCR